MKAKEIINIELFHGSSEPIEAFKNGLIGGRHNAIFLTDNPELALDYAISDRERTGNDNLILIKVNSKDLNQKYLYGDIDHSNIENWRESLAETDQCMYLDTIPVKFLTIVDYTNEG